MSRATALANRLALATTLTAGMTGHSTLALAQQSGTAAGACSVRLSVLQSYAPLASSLSAADKLNSQRDVAALKAFDMALANALDEVPVDAAAPYALTDVERLVEANTACAEALRLSSSSVGLAGSALERAYQRNVRYMSDPAFARRMMRAPRAQAALQAVGSGSLVTKAAATTEAEDTAARQKYQAELAAYRAKLAAEEAARTAPIRAHEAIWRKGASAPPLQTNVCTDDAVMAWQGKPKDAAWMALMEQEAGKCARISKRRDGPIYLGLALGTHVTDEQIAHSVGQQFMCMSDDPRMNLVRSGMAAVEALWEAGGLGKSGFRPKAEWSERWTGSRRIVRVSCGISMTLFGQDLTGLAKSWGQAMAAIGDPFVEYEIVDGILHGIRTRAVITNTVKTETSRMDPRYREVTTYTCDGSKGTADGMAADLASAGWRVVSRLPWKFQTPSLFGLGMNRGPAVIGEGQWYTLQRGEVVLDLFNTSYAAPVTGENGSCNQGVLEIYALPPGERTRRVRPGKSVDW